MYRVITFINLLAVPIEMDLQQAARTSIRAPAVSFKREGSSAEAPKDIEGAEVVVGVYKPVGRGTILGRDFHLFAYKDEGT